MEEYVSLLLDNALDSGLKELEFWEMTPAEVNRAIASSNRIAKAELKERATFDYIQANLIIKGFSIVMGGKGGYPSIHEAYPSVFEDMIREEEEKIQKKKDELSALRFRQFAEFYNTKNKKEVSKEADE